MPKETVNNNQSAIDSDLEEMQVKDRLEQAYSQLYGNHNLLKISDISDKEIGKLTIIKTYADEFGFYELSELVENFLKLRISRQRKGRDEHVKISGAEVLKELLSSRKGDVGVDKRIEKG